MSTTTPSQPLPPIHHHPDPLTTLPPHLLPHLPHSLPLLRRLQHNTSLSPTSHVFATIPPTATATTLTPPLLPFAALSVDRARAPETECWLFSSYETSRRRSVAAAGDEQRSVTPASGDAGGGSGGYKTGAEEEEEEEKTARLQVLALLEAAARLEGPSGGVVDGAGEEGDQKKKNNSNGDLMILGTLSETLLPLLAGDDLGCLKPMKVLTRDLEEAAGQMAVARAGGKGGGKEWGGVLVGVSVPYCKWLIASAGGVVVGDEEDYREGKRELPDGYRFSTVQRRELRDVIARTEIPRTEKMLLELGNVGVRYWDPLLVDETPVEVDGEKERAGQLIAWAFLGGDGSLKTLHVEPDHRGKGIAKAVCRRLFGRLAREPSAMGFRAVEGGGGAAKGLAHSDVAESNVESAGVARGLGGRVGWRVRWVGVDLGKVRSMVRELGGEAG